jgi:DNA-binding MurR/RpiR family transcriptional regulator
METRPTSGSASARIRGSLPALSDAERRVADWILVHTDELLRLSMSQIANICGVSDTTVLRMCRTAGFEGYTAMKYAVAQELVSPTHLIHRDLAEGDDAATIVNKIFAANVQSLQDTLELLDIHQLVRAVELIEGAGRVVIAGVGASQVVAQSVNVRLTRLGIPCIAPNDAQAQLTHSALLEPNDLLIAVSYSGTTKDIVAMLRQARIHGGKSLVFTGNASSPIAELADVTVVSVSHEIRGEPFAAKASQLAIIDSIAVLYAFKHLESTSAAELKISNAIIPKYL